MDLEDSSRYLRMAADLVALEVRGRGEVSMSFGVDIIGSGKYAILFWVLESGTLAILGTEGKGRAIVQYHCVACEPSLRQSCAWYLFRVDIPRRYEFHGLPTLLKIQMFSNTTQGISGRKSSSPAC